MSNLAASSKEGVVAKAREDEPIVVEFVDALWTFLRRLDQQRRQDAARFLVTSCPVSLLQAQGNQLSGAQRQPTFLQRRSSAQLCARGGATARGTENLG